MIWFYYVKLSTDAGPQILAGPISNRRAQDYYRILGRLGFHPWIAHKPIIAASQIEIDQYHFLMSQKREEMDQ